jgi:hypothetical protein
MFDVCPALSAAFGGDSVAVSAPAPTPTPAPVASETKPAPAPPSETKRPSLAELRKNNSQKLSGKKSTEAKSPSSSSPMSSPVTASAANVVPVAAAVQFDPAVLDGLKAQIEDLKAELEKSEARVTKALKEVDTSFKRDVLRLEKNSRAFQEGGQRCYDSLSDKMVGEVRKVRETLRKGITGEMSHLNDVLLSVKGIASVFVVLNSLSILLLLALMMMG